MPMRKKDPIAEMLGTSNKKEQVEQIQQLAQLANAPVLTIVVTFDSRTQRVDAKQVGGEAPNEILQQIFDAAKNLFNQQEIAKQVELAQAGGSVELPTPEDGAPPEIGAEDIQDIPAADPEGVQNAE